MDEFFVKDGEEEKGPFTFDELTDGRLEPNDMVRTSGSNWEKASDILDFAEYFQYEGYYFPTENNLAGFGIRLLAYLIDYFILVVVIVIGFMIAGNYFNYNIQDFAVEDTQKREILQAIVAGAFVLYNLFCYVSPLSSTLGQTVCKLVIVDANGKKLNFFKALIRSLGKLLSLAFFGVGFLGIFFSQYKQAFHDVFAKTYVIKKDVF
jgi:uncharacterized RDD family membrane protein YckC